MLTKEKVHAELEALLNCIHVDECDLDDMFGYLEDSTRAYLRQEREKEEREPTTPTNDIKR